MTKVGDCIVSSCDRLNGFPAAVLCVLLFIVQSAFMNYYLVHYLSALHLLWITADAVNLTLLILAVYQSRKALLGDTDNVVKGYSIAWISWLGVSIIVASKTIVIFNEFPADLEQDAPTYFGPNTLKTTIALGSCIFLLLLTTQHVSILGSESRRYIEELTGTVVFDLLDTVDILDILFDEKMQDLLWTGLKEFILTVATLNLVIPAVPLFTLSKTDFGRSKIRRRLVYIHRLMLVLVINIPNLLVRMVLWHGFSVGISPFSLKNIILICMTLFEFYEHKKEKYEEHQKERLGMDGKNGHSSGSGEGSPGGSQSTGGHDAKHVYENTTGMSNEKMSKPLSCTGTSTDDDTGSVVDFAIEQRMVTDI